MYHRLTAGEGTETVRWFGWSERFAGKKKTAGVGGSVFVFYGFFGGWFG